MNKPKGVGKAFKGLGIVLGSDLYKRDPLDLLAQKSERDRSLLKVKEIRLDNMKKQIKD
jgi:hypothetical protein